MGQYMVFAKEGFKQRGRLELLSLDKFPFQHTICFVDVPSFALHQNSLLQEVRTLY